MIPEKFLERMKRILGEDTDKFICALEEEAVKGLRVNTLKTDDCDLSHLPDVKLSPLPYASDGYTVERGDKLGNTPEHHAGMFYMQDPGAMATVNAVNIERGWCALDVCAAPGGKSSQIAAKIGEEGLLYANEYVPKRAKIIVSNFERLGIKNAVVTSLDTRKIGEMYRGYFDLVLCDAPCSGEGMFRKYDEAITEWSEDNVRLCAERQREILNNLAGTVKAGGYLLYSTCTYSREENEDTVADFIKNHPEFSLCEVEEKLKGATADGLDGMKAARRFYPHLAKGEGQFIALMKKDENCDILSTILYKEQLIEPSKQEIAIIKKFISDNINGEISGRFINWGEQIALVPHDLPIPQKSFMPGIMLGEVKKGNFFPHHQFFSAYGDRFKRQERLTRDDPRTEKYLRGEEIDSLLNENGWCAVTYEGVALGGGKISGGRVKNHYPKGLRNN